MSNSKYETLKNMRGSTAKHAQWFVRVLNPKEIEYTFVARSEAVNASKFECLLVSQDPKQYMLATVPFRLKDREAAKKAKAKFGDGTVWILKQAAFETKAKLEFNSCPQKSVVLLMEPTKLAAVTPVQTAELAYPSKHIEVALNVRHTGRLEQHAFC